jgi:hypothetical protein
MWRLVAPVVGVVNGQDGALGLNVIENVLADIRNVPESFAVTRRGLTIQNSACNIVDWIITS